MEKYALETGNTDPSLNLEAYLSENSDDDENEFESPPRVQRNKQWNAMLSIKSPFRKGKDQKDDYSVQTEMNSKKQPKKPGSA